VLPNVEYSIPSGKETVDEPENCDDTLPGCQHYGECDAGADRGILHALALGQWNK
jgi:hypothetical protein